MVTVFEEQCLAVGGGWTAMRYHGGGVRGAFQGACP